MSKPIIVPAQIRAARAMMEWSQEELAEKSEVSLSTVRDVESQRRPLDTSAAASIHRALENAGLIFIPGAPNAGPGVRLVAGRPQVIRPPTVMTMWDGLPFAVEWQGKAITVYLSREAIDDLGRFRGDHPNAEYLKVFEKYRGSILDDVARALKAGKGTDKGLRLTGADLTALR
ncbi:transcriptional regulator with XRE-family HTH domain [Bradyrhizobium japonicum]